MEYSHNPYFNRWFSAINKDCSEWDSLNSHNPYFNRWFSAIKINGYIPMYNIWSQSLF